MTTLPRPTPHILVVNGRKVRNPVFVIGAPGAGTEMLARALKRTPGFHLTLGQRWVLPVANSITVGATCHWKAVFIDMELPRYWLFVGR